MKHDEERSQIKHTLTLDEGWVVVVGEVMTVLLWLVTAWPFVGLMRSVAYSVRNKYLSKIHFIIYLYFNKKILYISPDTVLYSSTYEFRVKPN